MSRSRSDKAISELLSFLTDWLNRTEQEGIWHREPQVRARFHGRNSVDGGKSEADHFADRLLARCPTLKKTPRQARGGGWSFQEDGRGLRLSPWVRQPVKTLFAVR